MGRTPNPWRTVEAGDRRGGAHGLHGDPKHGLTAREYLVGVPALRMAILRAQSGDGPGSDALIVSADNLAFAKANLAELKPKLEAAEGKAR